MVPNLSSGSSSFVTSNSASLNVTLNSYDGSDLPQLTLFYDDESNYSSLRQDYFVPLSFNSNLALWLDANDSSSIINAAGSVSEWRDKSGNNLHMVQGNAANQPTTGSQVQNGLNVISFDGDDYLTKNPSNISDFDQTWLLVTEINTGSVTNSGQGLIAYSNWGDGWHVRANNNSNFRGKLYKNSGTLGTTQFVTNQLTGYQLFSFSFDRTNLKYSSFRNGTVKDSMLTDTTALPENKIIRIFAGSTNTKNLTGKLAEVICIKSSSVSDRQRVEGFLAHKWGISSQLANSHPFFSTAPSSNLPLRQINMGGQGAGIASQNVTGLSNGTTYHYRFLAKNSGGSVFSSTESFTTIGPASLTTIFPSSVTQSSATLQSMIISNGQEDPAVTFYWGDNNGSNVSANWDSNQILSGTHGAGMVSHSISGLSTGVSYYFTAKAVNSAGTSWAPVKSFQAINNFPPNDVVPPNSLVMNENLPIGTALFNFTATDPDPGATFTFSLSDLNSTTQNALFSIDSNGTLRNLVSFDFENNASTYLIRVRATDQLNAFREEEFTVQLQNVNEPLTIISYGGTSPKVFNRLENNSIMATVLATDPDSSVSYSISGGSDQALFSVDSNNGQLRFLQAPDFEVRLDSDSGNDYDVTVRASDGSFFSDQNFTFNMVNTEDPPEIDLIGVSSISANSATIEGNLTAFTGANQPQISLYYDNNTSYFSARGDPHTPYNLNGKLSFWFDANDSSTLVSAAGVVSQWNDKSGNNHNLSQDTNSSKPTTNAHTQNGLNVVHFDGDDLLKRNYSNILDYDQTWVMVAQIDTGGLNNNGDSLISYGGGNDGRWELRANNTNNFTSKIAKDGNWLQGTLTRNVTFDAFHIFTISFDRNGSTLSNWVDGELRTNGLMDPIGIAEKQKILLMGNRANTPQTLGGKVAEVLCLRSVDTNERLRLEGYLAHKWDLNASLHSTHPYRTNAPTLSQPLDNISLGSKPLGSFTHNLTGLTAATTYHYRFFGDSGVGKGFSSTGSFTTTALAQIVTRFPTDSTASSATIRAEVLSTGGENVGVSFFWGDNNASNQPGNWDNNFTLNGTHGPGMLTHAISNLSGGTTYYFAARASNSAGDSWSPVRSFQAINNAPPSDIIATGALTMAENLSPGSIVVDFNATDPDPNPSLTYALVDTNSTTQNNLFTLDGNGSLRTTVAFDYETNASSYTVRLRVTDQHFAYREEEFVINLLDINEAPYFTSFTSASSTLLNRYENRTLVTRVQASDHEPGNLTYSLSGGADQALFDLNVSSGLLSFTSPPDFEVPEDSDTNNIYLLTIQATDGINAITHDLNVSIVNSNEAPVLNILPTSGITGTSVVLEGNLTAYTGGTQATVILEYDTDANYSSNRVLESYNLLGRRLAFWLDANDTSSIIAVDGNVSQWRDKSGNNHHVAQDSNDSKPQTGIFTQNGLNVVNFDGNDFLRRNYSNILNTNLTCFAVARVDTGGIDQGGDAILSYGYGGDGRWEIRAGTANSFNSKVAKNASWLQTTSTPVSFDSYHLYTLHFDKNASTFSSWVNGSPQNVAVPDPYTLADKQKITIMGNRENTTKTIGGKMAEVIFIREINDLARKKIEGYLTHKWGITGSLPSNHPHRFSRPLGNVPKISINLGTKPVGTFTQNLTGLIPGTQYHFRYRVSNPNGIDVTPIATFSTIGLPLVNNSSSSFVTSNSATVSATLSSTGGDDANVSFFWGDDDAANIPSNWDHNFTFAGTRGVGNLTHSISGLTSGTQYFFKVMSTNLAGTMWSATYPFSTLSNQSPATLDAASALTIVENQAVGTAVADFNATDPDPNSTFTYSLVSGAGDSGNAYFSMDSNGTLRTATIFDFETNATTQSIRVEVRDEKNASLVAIFSVSITDDGQNDGAAEWFTVSGGQGGSPYYTFTDSSGQTPDFNSYTFMRGSTYMFVNGGVSGSHPFMLGESYNNLNSAHVFGNPLNSNNLGSKITLVIPSYFNGTMFFFCTAHAGMQQQLLIGSPNSNSSPHSLAPLSSLTIAENEPVSSVVGAFNATDPDANASLTYHLVSGQGSSGNSLFSLDLNGSLTSATIFDFESNQSLSIRVQAKDEFNATTEGNFTVSISNVNEAPVITQGPGPLSLTVAEDSSLSYDLNATDVDAGTTLIWSLAGAASNGTAAIDSSTGVFTYSPNANFYGSDSATVNVSDSVLSVGLVINLTVTPVNDAPVITQGNGPLSYSLNEDSNFSFDLNATDLEGDVLTWSIASDPTNGTATVTAGTGMVTYVPTADFEGNDSLTLTVSDATLSDSVVVNLTVNGVNDTPSSISNLSALSFSENLALGSSIGTFSATDPDMGDLITFSLFDNDQSTDSHLFSIDSNGTLRTAVLFDFESNASTYQVRVRATDSSYSSLDSLFSLTLTDQNEAPVISSTHSTLSLSLNEDHNLTHTLTANDPDAGDSITWSVQTSPLSGLATIDTNGTLHYQPYLNFNGSDSLVVSATDTAGLSNSLSLLLSINAVNDAPEFDLGDGPISLSLSEDSTLLQELNVTDPDTGETLTWSTTSSPTHGTLELDANTGSATYVPNLNFNGSDSFQVTVTDAAGSSDSILFNLSVTPVNDAPTIDGVDSPMSVTILEDSSFAYDLNGSDPDSGDTLTWTISQASANGSASIDSSTGVLDYAPNTDFNGSDFFFVHLSDGLLHHSLSVQISITGINDAPSGISHPSDLNFTENLPFGSIISVLSALDPDPGDSHTFNLLNSEDSSLASVPFSLDTNGTLRTASSFDFESNASTYSVQVQATDLAGSTVVSTLSLNLINVIEDIDGDTIEDAYDPDIDGDGYTNEQEIAYGSDPLDPLSMLNRAPSFSGSTSFSVVENNQTAVFLLSASDLDTDDILSFSISGPDAAKFSVNAATGGISFLQAPDFEANGSVAGDNLFLLSIQVSDGEDSASSSITIEVLDIYEPPPNDPPTDLLLSASILEENLPAGSLIGSFSTLDPDDPSGEDQYLYELVTETSSDQPTAFVVDENGSLYSGMAFDFESQSSHSIRVRTTDHYGESFEKSFSISVSDAFIPIVRTDTSTDLSSSGATLSATILDQGGTSGVFRSGILVSQAPEPMLGNFGSSDFPSTQMADGLSITANNLLSGTRYYFRAYAENSEGISYGSSQLFETVSSEASPHWASATPAPEAPNWWNSTWLGTYYSTDDSGWILHSELGWIFALPSPESGVWFWLQERGWMWTDSGLYPYLFDNPSSSWVYFYGGDQRRLLFYNYKLGSWIQVAKEQALSQ